MSNSRNSYMPAKQDGQREWSANFVNIVGEGPGLYGVPAAMMTEFTALNTTLQSAWTLAANPVTRTKGTVAAKNNALKAMRAAAKNIVSIIQGTPSVTDQMKINAGLTVRDTTPTRKPAPNQKPYLIVTNVDGRNVTVELRQDLETRSKPVNVTGATILTATGESAPMGGTGWTFAANTTRTRITIPFGPSETGDTVWITAFWTNAKDESGPAATPISVNLPAGGILPSEAAQSATETPALKAA